MGEENLNPRDAYRVMLRDYPDVLNIDQMCEILSVSTKTGYALLKKGSVQHLKVGRSYRIPKAHLLTYLIGFAPGRDILAFSPAVGYTDGVSGRSYIFKWMQRQEVTLW